MDLFATKALEKLQMAMAVSAVRKAEHEERKARAEADYAELMLEHARKISAKLDSELALPKMRGGGSS